MNIFSIGLASSLLVGFLICLILITPVKRVLVIEDDKELGNLFKVVMGMSVFAVSLAG